MANNTRASFKIIATSLAACIFVPAVSAAEFRTPISETGYARDLVNRPGCWTGETAGDWDRCLFGAIGGRHAAQP